MVFQRNNSPFSEFFNKNQHLTVTHEYNFLGNIIDNNGNFKRSIQELSKKCLKVLSVIITRFSKRVTRRVPLLEQELLTLPEHLSSPPFLLCFLHIVFTSVYEFH